MPRLTRIGLAIQILLVLTILPLSAKPLPSIQTTSTTSPALPAVGPSPQLAGWGGSGLRSTDCAYANCNSTWPASSVFPGQLSSSFEMEASKLHNLGYNIIRASFNPGGSIFPTIGTNHCAPDTSGNTFGIYNSTQLRRAIRIANYYALWIIVDYHSYDDMNSTYVACWMNGWATIVDQFKDSYNFLIWEPLNEPSNLPGTTPWARVNNLGVQYNNWIQQARDLGDNHYVVVQNLCSSGCWWDVDAYWKGYPGTYNNSQPIIDPQQRVFLSVHAGMGWNYDYPVNWCRGCDFRVHQYYNYTTADQFARDFYLSMRNATSITGWPILNTEGGALPHCGAVQECLDLELATGLQGPSGYTNVTLRFIQTLTSYLNNNNPNYGYVWYPMASWAAYGSPGAGTYGALEPKHGWGVGLPQLSICTITTSAGAYSADRDGDGRVDIIDLSLVTSHFGTQAGDGSYDPRADVNLDGVVNIFDIALVASMFGTSC